MSGSEESSSDPGSLPVRTPLSMVEPNYLSLQKLLLMPVTRDDFVQSDAEEGGCAVVFNFIQVPVSNETVEVSVL